jgi:hypothetical protein
MANFTVTPSALVFGKYPVQGPIPGLYATPPTAAFILKNTSGASVTITNYGFSSSTEGDAVTQPAGIYTNSDFVVVPTASAFPVTVGNGATQSFTVTYSPLRRGSSFGDIRSAILCLFAGSLALSNGGQTLNSSGEVVNLGLPKVLTIGVGGGVSETGYDWPTTHPIMGMPPNFTIADLDTGRHAVSAIELYSGAPATGAGPYTSVGNVSVGARGVQVLVYGLDPVSSLDLTISVGTTTGHVAVQTWTGLTYATIGGLFLGNNEGIDLQGLPLYATLTNVTNPNTTTIAIGVVVTG